VSELRTNRIIPTAGISTNGGGGIIQVVSHHKTDAAEYPLDGSNVVAGEELDIGLSLTINIQCASNKVLLMGHISHNCDDNQQAHFNLLRNAVGSDYNTVANTDGGIVKGAAGGSQWRCLVSAQANQDHLDNWAIVTSPFYYLDSPGCTGLISYSIILIGGVGGSKKIWINRGERDEANTHYDGRASSNITAMEVCA
jgi:hypothetical protein